MPPHPSPMTPPQSSSQPSPRRSLSQGIIATLVVLGTLTACGGTTDDGGHQTEPSANAAAKPEPNGGRVGRAAPTSLPDELPGVGPKTLAQVPERSRQVLLVTGEGRDSARSRAVLYERAADGDWRPGTSWPAHNALRGWTDKHLVGDLRSPNGVYALTDAGGLLENPGSKLPYDRSPGFTAFGTGSEGEPLEGSFDYVVAINYNRKSGTSPLDWTRPMGPARGGGIWLHVDHGGPTQGCVSLAEHHMRDLLRALDPAHHPVIVMGDEKSLAR
ncbi:hypothetical protein [Streptomyces zagrosensis]|uniref:L,D-peptidoglycan transpeptidase YkuD (ErfK/YbiS/YcfS/YnhG family) n=1 Tax=Streptomyces zagrosensis TaxID=1042984 RepID=A0A7W9Q5Y3_9ACTN|nr:hypothetical protein [Streptomyces zagrosensis]MBB5933999.1 L,D-peptidoglycan transpeptidase YkuD (ErfK/YbiS/YcfS/YnhG family) [Streptomyces zagrosensis]